MDVRRRARKCNAQLRHVYIGQIKTISPWYRLLVHVSGVSGVIIVKMVGGRGGRSAFQENFAANPESPTSNMVLAFADSSAVLD